MNKKIIATIGPSSFNKKTIQKMDFLGVDYFRINLSHTDEKNFESLIIQLREWTDKKICPDTEGAQLRIGQLHKNIFAIKKNQEINLFGNKEELRVNELILNIENPGEVLSVGDILNIDFNGAAVQVIKIINEENVLARTLKEGLIASNKGIGVDREICLPCFTQKDKKIISIANKLNLGSIFFSFCSYAEDVKELRSMFEKDVEIISKIENSLALKNLSGICKESNSILIDRGDLSREVQLEKIPRAQKYIIKQAKKHKKPVFVATNLMESMLVNSQPTRAELNDIAGALDSGVSGLVLAAETAIGKYPIDSVRILSNIMHEYKIGSENSNYQELLNFDSPLINEPYGGRLIQQFSFCKQNEFKELYSISIDKKSISDVLQICEGTYSPLNRFMCISEIKSVLETNKLRDGLSWTLPIVLQIDSKYYDKIPLNEPIVLRNKENNSIVAIMEIEKIEKLNKLKNKFVNWFGTEDKNHPGLNDILSRGDLILSGKPFLINEQKHLLKSVYELSPKQTRSLFHANGWHKIIGFHTKNIPHMGHQYIQNEALKEVEGDCLFISPVCGIKQNGEFNSDIVIKTYNALIQKGVYFPYSAVLGGFNTYSRYCGQREVFFSAICRKNFGCSHFIIDCDHIGVEEYYKAEESKKNFEKLDMGIKLLSFGEVVFDNKKKRYIELGFSKKTNSYKKISTTILREEIRKNLFQKNYLISDCVYKIISKMANKEDLFIN